MIRTQEKRKPAESTIGGSQEVIRVPKCLDLKAGKVTERAKTRTMVWYDAALRRKMVVGYVFVEGIVADSRT